MGGAFGGFGGGAGIVGGVFQGLTDIASSALGAVFAQKQAAKAFRRQQELIYLRPQLEVKGLRAAGLNPILAATGGWQGSAAGVARAAQPGVARSDALRVGKELGLMSAQRQLLDAQTMAAAAASARDAYQARTHLDQRPFIVAHSAAQARLRQAEAVRVELENTLRRADARWFETKTGRTFRAIERIKDAVSPFVKRR